MSAPNLLPLLAALALSSVAPLWAVEPTARLVHVSGKGEVTVAPDRVVIALTLNTTDDDLVRVRENSDKAARNVLAVAKKHGCDDNCFRVSRLQLSFGYNEELRRQIYKVERDVNVELNDFAKLDPLLSDLLPERNLKVKGIHFETSKEEQYESDALSRAVADAKNKAKHLAVLNGFTLGKARSINVTGESQQPFVTSVIPVVGSSDRHPFASRPARDWEDVSDQLTPHTGNTRVPLQPVALQPERAAEKKERPAGSQFAVGTIAIAAQVEIVFELTE